MLPEWNLPPADIYAVFPDLQPPAGEDAGAGDFLLAALECHRLDEDCGWCVKRVVILTATRRFQVLISDVSCLQGSPALRRCRFALYRRPSIDCG